MTKQTTSVVIGNLRVKIEPFSEAEYCTGIKTGIRKSCFHWKNMAQIFLVYECIQLNKSNFRELHLA